MPDHGKDEYWKNRAGMSKQPENVDMTPEQQDQADLELLIKKMDASVLPDDKQCSDCANFKRCVSLLGSKMKKEDHTMCAWSPSKYKGAISALPEEFNNGE